MRIVVDGVFFQLYQTGIARVWRSLLEQWATTELSAHIVVLDRAGTAPDIAGIQYYPIAPYRVTDPEGDRHILQQACDQLGADVFISTYFTQPLTTPTVVMVYDMVPEAMGEDATHPIVSQKREAIANGIAYITISENTANDVLAYCTDQVQGKITVAYCGVDATFHPATTEEITAFKARYGITKPYIMAMSVDNPSPYKNNALLFQGFAQLASKTGFDIVGTALSPQLPDEWRTCTTGSTVHLLRLTDEELAVAYAGAIALVYPSKYEGFGMPIVEAMACGCPVITCPNASIPEVGGTAVLYVDDGDASELADALCDVQKPGIRQALIAAGLEQAQRFSWQTMAATVQAVLVEASLTHLNLRPINWLVSPDWHLPETELYDELVHVIQTLLSHPERDLITLLIDGRTVPDDIEPSLMLGDVLMSMLMDADWGGEEPSIALVDDLHPLQWQVLAQHLVGWVVLSDEGAIALAQQYQIPLLTLSDLA